MSLAEKPICQKCGYIGPKGARYCAQCGRSLVPLRVRLTSNANHLLDRLSALHLALLGLIVLVPIGLLSQHLLVYIGLYFPYSLVLLAFVIGVGGIGMGWVWSAPLSNRSRLARMLLIFVSMTVLLLVIWQFDRVFLSLFSNSDRIIVSDIPGVHLEASGGYKRWYSVSDPPPYWLISIGFFLLNAVASILIGKLLEIHRKIPKSAA